MYLIWISLGFIFVALCLLIVLLLSVVISIKRAVFSFEVLADTVLNEIQPSIRKISGLLVELKPINDAVAKHASGVKSFMSTLEETLCNRKLIIPLVK